MDRGRFCLSQSEKRELGGIADCLRQLTTYTWQQVRESGGKHGRKRGLGYTPYDDADLRHVKRPAFLDPNVTIVGVRVTDKYRMFGAYIEHVFYVFWFDRNHEIVDG